MYIIIYIYIYREREREIKTTIVPSYLIAMVTSEASTFGPKLVCSTISVTSRSPPFRRAAFCREFRQKGGLVTGVLAIIA